MLELDPGLMIWAWVTFFVLLLILYKVAWKPILSVIDNREKSIKDSIEEAENSRQEAEQLLIKHKEMIDSAASEAQSLLKENRALAEKTKQEIIEQAKYSAQKMLDKAKIEIEKEKESALLSLRTEVADLTISATKKIINESLDESKQRALIDDFIQKIPKSTKN